MRGEKHTKALIDNVGKFFRKNYLYIFSLVLLVLVPVLIYFSINWDSRKIISQLSINGNDYVPQEIIMKLIPDSLYKKEKGKIELNKIASAVEQYPFVESANAMFASGNAIKIELKIRQPVARLTGNSEKALTDVNGVVMPDLFFDNFSSLPVLRNCFNNDVLDTTRFDLCLSLLNFINNNFQVVSAMLKAIDTKEDDNIELILKKNEAKVLLGDTNNKFQKINKLDVFLTEYLQGAVKRKVMLIDLRWSRQLVVN
jgi:cell division septal protein FtsQ